MRGHLDVSGTVTDKMIFNNYLLYIDCVILPVIRIDNQHSYLSALGRFVLQILVFIVFTTIFILFLLLNTFIYESNSH